MNLLMDFQIDEELWHLFESILHLDYPNPTEFSDIIKKGVIPETTLYKMQNIISLNFDYYFHKRKQMLHIIIHDYIYYKMLNASDEAKEFCELIEKTSFEDLISQIQNDDELDLQLIATYYQIHLDLDLENLVNDNKYLIEYIPWINTWYEACSYECDTITSKLRDILILFRDALDYAEVEEEKKDKIIKDFFWHHRDIFNIIPIHFNNHTEFLAYLPLLVQLIYVDTYFYLISCPNISSEEKELLGKIEERINQNNLTTLPDDFKEFKLLLNTFYNACMMRKDLMKENNDRVEQIRKLIKEKTNKSLLLDYC